jgi:hypothetical protein
MSRRDREVQDMGPDELQKYRYLLSNDLKVKRWPKKSFEKRFVLEYLQSKFARETRLTEKEVNAVIQQWHLFGDHALLRREMFERGLMNRTRDGREYWITSSGN